VNKTPITQTFENLKKNGRKALIPYVSCGDPSLEFTEKLVLGLEEAGADLVELGIPYSDPVADGPTIQKASQRALAGGVTLEKVMRTASRIRQQARLPLLFMAYYNSIYRPGPERFVVQAAGAGISGLIVPDLPLEEALPLKRAASGAGIDLIFLAAPTSTAARLQKIAKLAGGFVYCVSVTGVTGSRKEMPGGLEEFLSRVRASTDLPLAVGFGVSGPESAARMGSAADGVIVGSSLIERIEKNLHLVQEQPQHVLDEACAYIKSLREALDRV
jgi:tryptophan synthase alpha chain